MAEEFLRVGGRGSDGKAKALRSDDKGGIYSQINDTRKLLNDDNTIDAGQVVESLLMSVDDYSTAKATIVLRHDRDIKVSIKFYADLGDRLAEIGQELIFTSEKRVSIYNIEYDLPAGGYYKLIIQNSDNYGTTLSSFSTEKRLGSGYSNLSKKIDSLVANSTSIVQLASGEVILDESESEEITIINKGAKEFIISFFADNLNNLEAGNGVVLERYRARMNDDVLTVGGQLNLTQLLNYQPDFWSSSTSSGGTTPIIPMLSEKRVDLQLKNETGNSVTFRYLVTGYR